MFFASVRITGRRVVFAACCLITSAIIIALFVSAAEISRANGDTAAKRAAFFERYGIDISASFEECVSITLPNSDSEAFQHFKEVQSKNGFDVTDYNGKTLCKYSYPLGEWDIIASVYVYRGNIAGVEVFDLNSFRYVPVSEFGE